MSETEGTTTFPDLWIEERHRDVVASRFRVRRTLFSGQSPFQHVSVVETEGHGKMLLNDGLIMLSERDEFVYHEMIAHVPLFVHPNPRKVLVIGGGDGGTAREVLRHQNIEECVMVEIDEMVVNACKEHIPQTAECLTNDQRLRLLIQDAVQFVAETSEKFDVVLVDSTDPIGPAQPLFGEDFYQNVKRILNEDGIVVSQGESPFYESSVQKGLIQVVNRVFNNVTAYNFSNLTYPGGLWTFTFASKSLHPIEDFKSDRVRSSGLNFSYYNSSIHKGAFALPEFMRSNLKEVLEVN